MFFSISLPPACEACVCSHKKMEMRFGRDGNDERMDENEGKCGKRRGLGVQTDLSNKRSLLLWPS